MLKVGIITAPRPEGQTYLGVSLDSYFRSWDIEPTIFAEPDSPGFLHNSRCEIRRNAERLGGVKNWLNALRQLYPADYIMICEDDISWNPYASYDIRALLMSNGIPGVGLAPKDAGFISPYCSKMNAWQAVEGPTWMKPRMPKFGWCGALCVILPEASAKYILDRQDDFIKYSMLSGTLEQEEKPVHLDFAIGRTLQDSCRPLITHKPTFVTHIGEVSTFPRNNTPQVADSDARKPAL